MATLGMAATTGSAGPSPRRLGVLVLGVLLLHGLLLLGVSAPLQVHLAQGAAPQAVQVRLVTPPPPAPRPVPRPPSRRAPLAQPPAAVPAQADPTAPASPAPATSATLSLAESPPAPSATASADSVGGVSPASPPAAQASADSAGGSAPAPAQAKQAPWPLIPLGALPPSQAMAYRLTGMDKGLTYHASGELRWQHNDQAYEMQLSVRAFLLGSRLWRSVGQIDASGLVPRRFSDNWRNERATHFDREQQRVVFSGNNTPVPLEPGAQDQVSLYVQLAAAIAGEPERFVPGARLQVQTATVRDAVPWSLSLEAQETLNLEDRTLQVLRWVGQPRNQYDAKLEIWVAASHAWLPVRIRITQTSGSYIDLMWRGTEPLPPLPSSAETTGAAKGS